MSNSKVRLGIIGCGNISGAYLKGCPQFENLEVAAVADIDPARAEAKAQEFNVPKACDVPGILADEEVEIVINLTIPKAHGEIALEALAAGKHVYNEKPLAITRGEGKAMLELAEQKGLRVGCAPDTFLGSGIQTSRKALDDGLIGEPIGATAFMTGRGPEPWHPDPEFFYQPGGGPMFDMGPYYLTALTVLLGPVRRVTGSARASFPERTIGSGAKKGQKIPVVIPTHIAGIMDFEAGPVGTILTSFDVWAANLPRIEIYGSEGTLSVPDPNMLGGTPRIFRDGAWNDLEITHHYTEPHRGIGVADMAYALRQERDHRASGRLAYHVLDLMHAFHDASERGEHIEMESTVERPAPLPAGDNVNAAVKQA
ncbi:MAG: Gfo/Idh/MocA family oxidoreductase [Armatimonadetes bacterium]|nr:Gfo/Idh/MocA family oxidoreductase [Armatimonadota bacterium]